jgi:hypothetical protein
MDERLRGIGYIRIDETPVQVIHGEKSGRQATWSGALRLAVVAIPRGALTGTGLGNI